MAIFTESATNEFIDEGKLYDRFKRFADKYNEEYYRKHPEKRWVDTSKKNTASKDESSKKEHGLITKEEASSCISIIKPICEKYPIVKKFYDIRSVDDIMKEYSKDKYDSINIGEIMEQDGIYNDDKDAYAFEDSDEGDNARERLHYPVDFVKFCDWYLDILVKIEKAAKMAIDKKYTDIEFYIDQHPYYSTLYLKSKKPKESTADEPVKESATNFVSDVLSDCTRILKSEIGKNGLVSSYTSFNQKKVNSDMYYLGKITTNVTNPKSIFYDDRYDSKDDPNYGAAKSARAKKHLPEDFNAFMKKFDSILDNIHENVNTTIRTKYGKTVSFFYEDHDDKMMLCVYFVKSKNESVSTDNSFFIEAAMSKSASIRSNAFKLATKCVKRIVSSDEYKNTYPQPTFLNYFDDNDFKEVYRNWADGDSGKPITICNFKKDEDYKKAFAFIKKKFEESKDHRSALAGSLSMSDKYGSNVDLNFKI